MSEKTAELTVLNPRGAIEARTNIASSPRINDLDGKTIGLYWNSKPGLDNFYKVFEELLKQKYPTTRTTILQGAFLIRDEDAEAWLPQIDTFIYAVGD